MSQGIACADGPDRKRGFHLLHEVGPFGLTAHEDSEDWY